MLEAVRTDRSLASSTRRPSTAVNDYDYSVTIDVEREQFEPFEIGIRDAASGKDSTVTVIGVWAAAHRQVHRRRLRQRHRRTPPSSARPTFDRAFVRLLDGVDAEEGARNIETALATKGVQAESIAS